MTMIIGICGPQYSGKSTIAKAAVTLLTERGRTARIVSFAEPLRLMLAALMHSSGMKKADITLALTSPEAKEIPLACLQGKTPRYALRTLGTEWGRSLLGMDVWTDIGLMNIDANPVDIVLIDDVRFDSEIDTIRKRQGRIVEMERIGAAYSTTHPSAMRPRFQSGPPHSVYNSGLPHAVARSLLIKALGESYGAA
jgi:hypothetical protein